MWWSVEACHIRWPWVTFEGGFSKCKPIRGTSFTVSFSRNLNNDVQTSDVNSVTLIDSARSCETNNADVRSRLRKLNFFLVFYFISLRQVTRQTMPATEWHLVSLKVISVTGTSQILNTTCLVFVVYLGIRRTIRMRPAIHGYGAWQSRLLYVVKWLGN